MSTPRMFLPKVDDSEAQSMRELLNHDTRRGNIKMNTLPTRGITEIGTPQNTDPDVPVPSTMTITEPHKLLL